MKKTIIAIAAMAVLGIAAAADFVSVGVDANQSRTNASQHATVETVRAGKDIGAGFDVVVQDRTQVQTQGGMYNSIEGTLGYQLSILNVYTGAGRDQVSILVQSRHLNGWRECNASGTRRRMLLDSQATQRRRRNDKFSRSDRGLRLTIARCQRVGSRLINLQPAEAGNAVHHSGDGRR